MGGKSQSVLRKHLQSPGCFQVNLVTVERKAGNLYCLGDCRVSLTECSFLRRRKKNDHGEMVAIILHRNEKEKKKKTTSSHFLSAHCAPGPPGKCLLQLR